MTARSVSVLGRGIRSAGSAAGTAAATLAGIGVVAFAVNWLLLFLVLPSEGALSSGAQMLVFGLAFPVGCLFAAQPFAVASGLRRFYRRHRDEVLSLVADALQREVGADSAENPDRWLRAFEALREHIDRLPRAVRMLLRLGLRRIPLEDIESALRSGSGPAPLRIAGAIADHLEAEFAGAASARWLIIVAAANIAGLLLILAAS